MCSFDSFARRGRLTEAFEVRPLIRSIIYFYSIALKEMPFTDSCFYLVLHLYQHQVQLQEAVPWSQLTLIPLILLLEVLQQSNAIWTAIHILQLWLQAMKVKPLSESIKRWVTDWRATFSHIACPDLSTCPLDFPSLYFGGTGWNSWNNSKSNIEPVTVRKCICTASVWLPGHDLGHVFLPAQLK